MFEMDMLRFTLLAASWTVIALGIGSVCGQVSVESRLEQRKTE
ncbi:MAG: hypothetical protein ACE3JQ_02535 [Paenisporosarcina sp.]